MRLLVINGPNLNMLGHRDRDVYGTMSLSDIEEMVRHRAEVLGAEVEFFQSNSEGAIIDMLQARYASVNAIVINPGALTHYGLSLRKPWLTPDCRWWRCTSPTYTQGRGGGIAPWWPRLPWPDQRPGMARLRGSARLSGRKLQ